MAYSLKIWNHPTSGAQRLYVNGTTRQAVYLTRRERDGLVVWSSKANDTPHKFQTGDHYGKVAKDKQAAHEVAEAFGIVLGETTWEAALEIAARGLEVEPE